MAIICLFYKHPKSTHLQTYYNFNNGFLLHLDKVGYELVPERGLVCPVVGRHLGPRAQHQVAPAIIIIIINIIIIIIILVITWFPPRTCPS